MADKTINELEEATLILQQDLFVLQQENTAKKLSGQTLVTYLLRMINGHGGIRRYEKVSTSGLVDTYRFEFADESTLDIPVTNGKAITSVKQTAVNGLTRTYTIKFNDNTSEVFTVTDGRNIQSVEKTNTSGLVDTYTITYNDGSKDTFTVTNGEKGDKGDNTYTHIKFASQEPTESSHSMGDIPDKWIGFYWGNSEEAPTDWARYKWYQFKGDKGDTGDPAKLTSYKIEYQVSDSGTIIPSGTWNTYVPVVAQGRYLWTRTTNTFNSGNPVVSYSVTRMGLDGSGSVSSVANISPDENGNVPLTPEDIGAGTLSMELLWKNQNVKSEFKGQDITIVCGKYDVIRVEFFIKPAYDYYTCAETRINHRGLCVTDDNNGHLCTRSFYPRYESSELKLTFEDGYYYGAYAAFEMANRYMVPSEIYGIKGVK